MIVTGGSVDTTVIAGGTEVNVESCTTAGSVCVDTLVLVNIEVAVMVLRISSVAQFSVSHLASFDSEPTERYPRSDFKGISGHLECNAAVRWLTLAMESMLSSKAG